MKWELAIHTEQMSMRMELNDDLSEPDIQALIDALVRVTPDYVSISCNKIVI